MNLNTYESEKEIPNMYSEIVVPEKTIDRKIVISSYFYNKVVVSVENVPFFYEGILEINPEDKDSFLLKPFQPAQVNNDLDNLIVEVSKLERFFVEGNPERGVVLKFPKIKK